VGMVFQSFNLFAHKTVLENVMLGQIKVRKADKKAAEEKARGLLDRVGVGTQADKYPAQLSGGQQQLVAIARAVIAEPSLLLADEPTGNLHTEQGAEIMKLFAQLNRGGTTIVQVTHSEQIASHSRRIVRMRDGRILSEGLTERL
jgi:glutamate transport system ATP-binding protein